MNFYPVDSAIQRLNNQDLVSGKLGMGWKAKKTPAENAKILYNDTEGSNCK